MRAPGVYFTGVYYLNKNGHAYKNKSNDYIRKVDKIKLF